MLSVQNQLAWMPSTIGAAAVRQNPPQELAFNAPDPDTAPASKEISLFGDDGFSFADLVDVVNPLQHIPLVSTYYRDSTGDDIAVAPRVIGSTLFFGPIGLASALANVFVESATGKDIGEHVASWISSDDTVETAGNEPDPATTAHNNGPTAVPGPEDPVLAWARAESDWSKQQARSQDRGPDKAQKAGPSPARSPAIPAGIYGRPVPDAALLLRDAPISPPAAPVGLAELAVLGNDVRAAARAYEIAANLRPSS